MQGVDSPPFVRIMSARLPTESGRGHYPAVGDMAEIGTEQAGVSSRAREEELNPGIEEWSGPPTSDLTMSPSPKGGVGH